MLRLTRMIALTGLVALLGIGITSCDSADRLAAPQDEWSAQFSPGANNARFSRVAAIIEFGATETVDIDAHGGVILVKHGNLKVAALVIQAGSVRNDTKFTVELSANPDLYVHLEATSQGSHVPNDVGMKGFKKPVYLLFNASALNVDPAEWSRLGIAELQDNGKIIPTRSGVFSNFWLGAGQFEGTWVVGVLPHFSGWVPVLN